MSIKSESATYIVSITLMTESGELPTKTEVEEMIADSISGELDETTGLFAAGVFLIGTDDETVFASDPPEGRPHCPLCQTRHRTDYSCNKAAAEPAMGEQS